jgi:hypothetical protein
MPQFEVKMQGTGALIVLAPLALGEISIEPSADGVVLTKRVRAESLRQAEEDMRSWSVVFSEALAVERGFTAQFRLLNTTQLPEQSLSGEVLLTVSAAAHADFRIKPEVPLTIDLLRDALVLMEKIASFPPNDLVRRASNWYSVGTQDPDPINKFMAHWVSLETLSQTYQGEVEPTKCANPECGRDLNPRPDGAVLREFLKALGFNQSVVGIAKKISEIRGRLFHKAGAVSEARSMQPVLSDLLKECLKRTFA